MPLAGIAHRAGPTRGAFDDAAVDPVVDALHQVSRRPAYVLDRQYRRQTGPMPPARRLVLASGSPARLALLRAAGFSPEVVVSGVDEVAVAGDSSRVEEVPELVERLARAKAEAVAERPEAEGAIVIGCDSLFELDGEVRGKPLSAENADRPHP